MTEILCINVGSSSIKTASFDDSLSELRRAQFAPSSHQYLTNTTAHLVVHRFVHGGLKHLTAARIDDALVTELEDLVELAPLHMPPALDALHAARIAMPNALHVACFDTAFHRTIPEVAYRYSLPVAEPQIRKYGFHGLSCEHVIDTLGSERTKRCVIAHLGSGCSVTAIRDSRSIDTSMGFTPAGGVMMATRPGNLDPGLLMYLLEHGMTAAEINEASGIKAIAGSTNFEELLHRDDGEAHLAIDMFCYSIVQTIGAYVTTLGGLDTIAFTGGIGEHVPEVRRRIVDALSVFLPFDVDVVNANEELVMARQALALI